MSQLTFIETIGLPKRYLQVNQLMVGGVAVGSINSIQDSIEYQINFIPLKKASNRTFFKRGLGVLSTVAIGLAFIAIMFLFVPSFYYMFFPAEPVPVATAIGGTTLGGDFVQKPGEEVTKSTYVPPYNENLPEGSWLVIPRIGVRTQLNKTDNPEEALAKGVWHVPEFGEPGDTSQPIILAAHRFGYQKWWNGTDYWKYHSFYLLPETEPGDRIEIIHDKRKWIYEIYSGELNQEITDYQADLILYTCRFLTGSDRHVRYARVVDPTVNTQALSAAN